MDEGVADLGLVGKGDAGERLGENLGVVLAAVDGDFVTAVTVKYGKEGAVGISVEIEYVDVCVCFFFKNI